MRDIIFRGRRTDNGEWVEGDLVRHYENQRRFIAYDQMAYTHTECGIGRLITERYCEVDPSTISQFTGLCDKNGKRIFEGDMFHLGAPSIVYTVEWYDTALMGHQAGTGSRVGLIYWRDRIEIIGTKWDNPELLKGGE